MPASSAVRRCLSQAVGQADRKTDSLSVGHTTSPAALSPVTNGAVQISPLWTSELRDNAAIDSGVQGKAPLVVTEPGGMQWSQYNNPNGGSRNNHRVNPNPPWVRVNNAGPVESDREPAACECLGAAGNRLCSLGLCKESDLQSYPHTDGQHHCYGRDQQDGGYSVRQSAASVSGSLEFLPREFKYSHGRPYSGHRECNSRLSESTIPGQERLEVAHGGLPADLQVYRSS